MIMRLIYSMLFAFLVSTYLDVDLKVKRQSGQVSYLMPIKIQSIPYRLKISLMNKEEYIQEPSEKAREKKLRKWASGQGDTQGVLSASSLQGYSFEGWKRFFTEAFLYIQQRYYHKIHLNLSSLTQHSGEQTGGADGLITFGPSLVDNKLYEGIKNNSQFIKQDYVSIYRGINDKKVKIQLGGYEENYASGYRNGILFYESGLEVSDDGFSWVVPIIGMNYIMQKGGKEQIFTFIQPECKLKITLQSNYLVLPMRLKDDFERNFETPSITCKVFENDQMGCYNMSSIDLALSLIRLRVGEDVYINITLYDLQDTKKSEEKLTMLFLKFEEDRGKLQLGEALFKNYYVSIDMKGQRLLYSPINRSPSNFSSVYLVRVFVGFAVFAVIAGIFIFFWRLFTDPFRKKRINYEHEGIRLVPYRKHLDEQE